MEDSGGSSRQTVAGGSGAAACASDCAGANDEKKLWRREERSVRAGSVLSESELALRAPGSVWGARAAPARACGGELVMAALKQPCDCDVTRQYPMPRPALASP